MNQNKIKISHDGRQLMIRIPIAIEEEIGLKKGDYLFWQINGKKIILEANNVKGKSN